MSTHITTIRDSFSEAADALESLRSNDELLTSVERFAALLESTFRAGGTIFSAGNGGSHCDAMHFAEEWTGRYRKDRAPMPAMALSDVSHITCTSNDYGFEHIFERSVEAFGKQGDIFLALSTSGNSRNLILAAEAARKKGMKVVGLLGKGGGPLLELCDIAIVVPGATSDRIQELHIKIVHIVIECVERALFPQLY